MRLSKKIEKKASEHNELQLKRFNDPMALKISWDPLIYGGSNYKTRELIKINSQRLEFKKTKKTSYVIRFYIILAILVSGPILVNLEFIGSYIQDEPGSIVMPAIFLLMALYHYNKSNVVRAFDKKERCFIYSRIGLFSKNFSKKERVRLSDIYAIQLLSEYVHTQKKRNRYKSYELNLVLKDKTRLNVVDYGNRKSIEEDSNVLSRFLDVPLWDGI